MQMTYFLSLGFIVYSLDSWNYTAEMKCNLRLISQSLFLDFSRLLTCKVHGVVHRIYQLKQCLCYYVFRYTLLLEQFSAVSYGDFLFGSFILLPLQQRFPVSLRKLVWEDHPQVLRSLAVPLEQVCEQLHHFGIWNVIMLLFAAATGHNTFSLSNWMWCDFGWSLSIKFSLCHCQV